MSKIALNKYKITPECIGCRACVDISSNNFAMNDSGKAIVVEQPKDENEEKYCADAALFCPVSAIITDHNQVAKTKNKVLVGPEKPAQKSRRKKIPVFGNFF